MWFKNSPKSVISTSHRRPLRRRPPPARLGVEALEDRALPTTYLYTDIGTLGGTYSRSDDVNALGQVVCTSVTVGGSDHAFLWSGGALIDLGTLGGAWSAVSAINDHGQIVGSADTADGIRHAFLLSPEDTNGDGSPDRWFRDSNGNGANDLMTALQLPAGQTASIALDINNAGEVVGGANDSAGRSHAPLDRRRREGPGHARRPGCRRDRDQRRRASRRRCPGRRGAKPRVSLGRDARHDRPGEPGGSQ